MSQGLDFLMRPVIKGLCKYESLKDGRVDLYDIALMNMALDVQTENEYRYQKNTTT